jgi:hypothetical protein
LANSFRIILQLDLEDVEIFDRIWAKLAKLERDAMAKGDKAE